MRRASAARRRYSAARLLLSATMVPSQATFVSSPEGFWFRGLGLNLGNEKLEYLVRHLTLGDQAQVQRQRYAIGDHLTRRRMGRQASNRA